MQLRWNLRGSGSASKHHKLSTLITVVQLAVGVAEAASVPFLKGVLNTTAKLLEIAQEIRDDFSDCVELAETSAELSLAINEQMSSTELGERWSSQLEGLLKLLEKIVINMTQIKGQSWYRRLLRRQSIRYDIAEFRRLLDHQKSVFGVLSQIDIKQHLVSQDKTLAEIVQKFSSGQYRIVADEEKSELNGGFHVFRRADIRLEKELIDPAGNFPRDSDAIEQHTTHIDGELHVVKVYRQEPPDRYSEDLELLKKLWHPNLIHLVGYSQPQVSERFIVVLGGTRSCESIQRDLIGLERYTFAVKMTSAFISAQWYLKQRGLHWFGQYDDMAVDPNVKLTLDVSVQHVRPFQQESFQSEVFTMIDEIAYKAVSPRHSDQTLPTGSASRLNNVLGELSQTFLEAKRLKLDLPSLWLKLVLPGFLCDAGANVLDWYNRSASNTH